MKFSLDMIKKGIDIANKMSNPNEAIKYLLAKMSKSQPETAKKLLSMIKSGSSPITAISEFASQGKFTLSELSQVKKLYSVGKKIGLKGFNVAESDWKKAENAIKQAEQKNPGLSKLDIGF